jgi:hypothetical protein
MRHRGHGWRYACALAGCGGSHNGAFKVKRGMTIAQVRKLVGPPVTGIYHCWIWPAPQDLSMRLCFRHGRVYDIEFEGGNEVCKRAPQRCTRLELARSWRAAALSERFR